MPLSGLPEQRQIMDEDRRSVVRILRIPEGPVVVFGMLGEGDE